MRRRTVRRMCNGQSGILAIRKFYKQEKRPGMWIYLNNAFLSIVQNDDAPEMLLVRARRSGDIESVFPDAGVVETPGADYAFRSNIGREVVADRIANAILSIDYPNFKNSVPDPSRRGIYSSVWNTTLEGFDTGMYSRPRYRENHHTWENSARRSGVATKKKGEGSKSSFLPRSTPPPEDRNVIDLTGEDLSKVDSGGEGPGNNKETE